MVTLYMILELRISSVRQFKLYLFGSGLGGTVVGGGDSQPGGGWGGIGLCGGGGILGRPLEDGGGAKGLLSACPISISRTFPLSPPPPPPLTESMLFIPAAKIKL